MKRYGFLKKYILVIIIISLSVIFLSKKNDKVEQAYAPIFLIVEFQGDYKIGDGEWSPVRENTHISSTKGPVTLKGSFVMRDPENNELLGDIYPETVLAAYLNHLHMSVRIDGQVIHQSDVEEPDFGSVFCGQIWDIFMITQTEEPVQITLTNYHKYGNENAVDDFLDKLTVYQGGEFERKYVEKGEGQRVVGLVIVLSAMLIWGTALFAFKLHIKNSYEMGVIGGIILFAGVYYIFSSENICLWNNNYQFNTSVLCLCKELYMLFITILILKVLSEKTYKAGKALVSISLCTSMILLFASIMDIILIYDAWFIWSVMEVFVCLGLLVCLFLEMENLNKENALIYSINIFILLSYIIDFIAVYFGWWSGTRLSIMFFFFMFAGTAILVLKIIPRKLEAVARAKELEAEQKILQAKLNESRIAMMMSQIQPHFIYNSLGVIEELCHEEPKKAEMAIGTLAEFLKGNMAVSMSDKIISFRDELNHTKKYLEIEYLRFEEQLSVVYDIQVDGFYIPALTLQPIVENAVRHGVRKNEEGGTVKISSRENEEYFEILVEDDGPGFQKRDENEQEGTHIGIKNVKERLVRMCNGELEVISEQGKGSCVIIRIKKESQIC